jgi:dihydrofolate synthase / folylpolyglutamate synthase
LNFEETLQYLYDRLPMFQRVGAPAYKASLDNIYALCEAIGNPHLRLKSIHVAGTNGKGSSSHTLAAVFQSAGFKTGLYTSPHLKRFTERIRVNGQEIPEAAITNFVADFQEVIEKISPSFFEITVAMAFYHFAQEQVDMAIIEVGLGGRLDATNIIDPDVGLITNIGWDHTEFLGDTLPKIAGEKAGIIKPKKPIVISQKQEEVFSVFEEIAEKNNSPIFLAEGNYRFEKKQGNFIYDIFYQENLLFENISLNLKGAHQLKNLGGILETLRVWQEKEQFILPKEAIQKGIEQVTQLTGLKGRWQVLGNQPKMVCDVGHNVDGLQVVRQMIEAEDFRELHLVMGVVKDKDVAKMLGILPKNAHFYFCQPSIPRGLEASLLAEKAAEIGIAGKVIPDVNQALKTAISQAHPDDLIFIGGSTFVVADLDNI